MHGLNFLQDLAVVMIVAGVVTVIFHRFKQPVVLGYIIAGVIIGPHTPPFPLIRDQETIRTLSELGIILLMFSLGLEFNLRRLKQVGGTAFTAALLEILLMVWVGYQIGRMFKWSNIDSLFLGAMLSISSTTIIVKALAELGKTRERFAELTFGILIIEDMLAIVMLALLSGVAMTGTFDIGEVSVTVGKLAIFLAAALVLGLLAVPRLVGYVGRFKSNEMLLITVLAVCFGFSLLAARLGYSVALGAFLIGVVVAEAREIGRIETLTQPIRDMFSAIFFVSIGLLIDPKMLLAHWIPVVVISLVVIIGKVVTCALGVYAGGHDTRTALRVGMGLAQIGEFSFIIASLGVSLRVTSEFLYPVAVAVAVITTLTTPYLIRNSDALVSWFERIAPRPVVTSLGVYTRWVGQLGSRSPTIATKLVRRWLLQMALNAALITAIFIAAAYLGERRPDWLHQFARAEQAVDLLLWTAALILSLPLFIATFRKLQALGLLIAETKVSETLAGGRAQQIRAIVALVVPVIGTIALGLYVLLLSSALLPPWEILLVVLALLGFVAWFFWRLFIRIYAKAQVALVETLSQPAPAEEPIRQLPGLLREAELELLELPQDSPAAGKLVRELQLRSRTGASIAGIERNGARIINPGPDEELVAGDLLLLIGNHAQLAAAREMLGAAGAQPG